MFLIAFFIVSMCVVVPFLYYYRNRHPNPRFRPAFGEMVMVSIFAVGAAGGLSLGVATLFDVNPDFEQMGKTDLRSPTPQRSSGGRSGAETPSGGIPTTSDDSFRWPWEK